MRHLVTVRTIDRLTPIDGADRIELAGILGWNVVVPKGRYAVGDKCVYFEIDSFLPIDEKFEFLRKSSFRTHPTQGEGFLIKTMEMRGAVSQGLVMTLPELGLSVDTPVDTDVTDILGVRKWEEIEMASDAGTMFGDLPFGMHGTDETRIQILPSIFKEFETCEYYITTKMDGTSRTLFINENDEIFCTTNNNKIKDDGKSSFWKLVHALDLPEKLMTIKKERGYKTVSVQGELCGPGVQTNSLLLKEPHWYVFTVTVDGQRLGLDEIKWFCETLGCDMVPVEEIGTGFSSKYPDIDAVLERAKGDYPNGGPKEGIVIRPTHPVYSPILDTWLSFKGVNNDYLLKRKRKKK